MKIVLTIICLFFCAHIFAQTAENKYAIIDSFARLVQAKRIDSLTRKLTVKYTEPELKVRAIFAWIAENVSYDATRSIGTKTITFRGTDMASALAKFDEQIVNKTFTDKKAVCEGYARLFKKMCTYAKIECELVVGNARVTDDFTDGSQKISHVWNAVKINSEWKLIDVTWGSGYVNNNNLFIKDFEDFYFFANPAQLKYSHLPNDVKWQLLSEAISEKYFFSQPLLMPKFFKRKIIAITPIQGLIPISKNEKILEIEIKTTAVFPILSIAQYTKNKNGNIELHQQPVNANEARSADGNAELKTLKKQFDLLPNTFKVDVFLGVEYVATYWLKRF